MKPPVDTPKRRTESTLVADQKLGSTRLDPKATGLPRPPGPNIPSALDDTKGDPPVALERTIKTAVAGLR